MSIQRLRDEFDDRNVALHLALGGLALRERLQRVLDAYAPPLSGASAASSAAAPDALVDFILGVIAFSERWRAVLTAEAERTPRPPEAATSRPALPDLRGLRR